MIQTLTQVSMPLTTNAPAGCTQPLAKQMTEVIIPQINRASPR
jgi:hypothetical protein